MWFRGREFITALSETVGYKTGLAINEERLHAIVEAIGQGAYWPEDDDAVMRIRSEDFEELFAGVLHRLGAGPPRRVVAPLFDVYRSALEDPEAKAAFDALAPECVEFLRGSVMAAEPGGRLDPAPFIDRAAESHGAPGREIAIRMVDTISEQLLQSPFSSIRRVEWEDVRDLDELFAAEKLESPHGDYFDQRFVNFLAQNFDEIDEINWRQFEGLAAEFFGRLGFGVKIGPGRGDDGVDIRLWPDGSSAEKQPAAVLVQCKRERRKISKTVVKALWADVEAEGADSGLVVTTSALSPGARAVRTGRGYPIGEADRDVLRQWVEAMRTPGAGVFLGE